MLAKEHILNKKKIYIFREHLILLSELTMEYVNIISITNKSKIWL